jgi:hypothetical protein
VSPDLSSLCDSFSGACKDILESLEPSGDAGASVRSLALWLRRLEAVLAACPASLAPEAAVRLHAFFLHPDGLFAALAGRHSDFKVARDAVGALFQFLLQHGTEAYAHLGEVRASATLVPLLYAFSAPSSNKNDEILGHVASLGGMPTQVCL